MATDTTYAQRVIAGLDVAKGYDPRHVEAYMRAEHGTLNHLSASAFAAEVKLAVADIEYDGLGLADLVARSFGL